MTTTNDFEVFPREHFAKLSKTSRRELMRREWAASRSIVCEQERERDECVHCESAKPSAYMFSLRFLLHARKSNLISHWR